jgi:hypothetical protein
LTLSKNNGKAFTLMRKSNSQKEATMHFGKVCLEMLDNMERSQLLYHVVVLIQEWLAGLLNRHLSILPKTPGIKWRMCRKVGENGLN